MYLFIKSLFFLLFSRNVITQAELEYLIEDLDERTNPEEFSQKLINITGLRVNLKEEEKPPVVDNYI